MGVIEFVAACGSVLLLIATMPFSLFFCFKVVQEYERAVIFRLGRLRSGGARGPGIFFVLPCVDSYCKVDLRTVSFDVPPQEALTKDSVTVTVDAVVYYRIQDPLNAIVQVTNYSNSTRLLAMTTLRNILGTRNLSEILSDREAISHAMQTSLDIATDPWGVKVERVEIKDVSLPTQLQRAMAAEAEASREARAKVIAAEGEMKASRALKEASDVISESPSALQVNIWMVEGNYVSLLKDVDCPKTKFKIRSNHVMAAHVAFHKAHMMTETSDQQFWSFGYKVNDPKAILCVPVITPEEQCVAVFDLYRTSEQPSYGEKELKISLVLAGWIGAAIQQNRDRIMLQEQKKINNMVLELMNKFYNGDIDLDEVLGCLMRLTKERTLAEKGKFYLIKTDSDDLQATVLEQGLYDDNLYRKSGKVSLLNSNTVAGSVARHRRSVLLKNLMLDRRFNRHFERSTGQYKKCIMALPIKGGRTVYGVLELENKDAPFPNYNFTPADEEFTRNIWQYCSLALSFDYVRLKYPTTLYNLKNDKLVVLKQIKPCPHDMEIVFDDDTTQPPSGFHLFSWYIGVNSKSNMPLYAFYMLKEVIGIENIDPELCKEFVLTCRKMYRNNPYHNFEHAFNVCHCLYSIVTRNKDAFTTLEANALLVAALCHDLDHLGVTNSFLMISDHNIYTLYGESCLENYHNMMGNLIWENCNFLINQTEEEYRLFIKEIKYDIIATDLSNYFKQRLKINVYMNTHSKFDFMLQEHKEFTRSMIMTCGDLSGSCKSFPVVMTMVTNLYKEFYRQGDMERDMGYTPLPIMDKNKIQSVPLEQIQFLNVLVLPCTNIVRFIFPNCSDIHMLATRVRDTWEQAAKVANTDAKWQDFVPKKKSVLCTLHTILGTECKYAI